ncbi:MAG: hypothetical protein JWR67_3654 [Mucilaginibacter sp.]|nr:hypothetical protein [Mucilaginibacter sp.]
MNAQKGISLQSNYAMSKLLKIIISLFCIPLGYAFIYISWDGVWNFGVLINSIMFCAGPILIIGGFVFFIIFLAKR